MHPLVRECLGIPDAAPPNPAAVHSCPWGVERIAAMQPACPAPLPLLFSLILTFHFPPPKNILHHGPASRTLHAVPSSLNLVNTWCCSRQDCRSFPGLCADETRLRTRCVAVIPAETHRGNAALSPYISPNHTARKAAVIVMAAPVRCIPTDIVLHHGRPQ